MKRSLSSLALSLCLLLPALTAQAAAYQVVPVDNGGRITGRVSFEGRDPAPKPYTVAKDTDTCGSGSRLIDFVRVKDGALQDAVVYLYKIKSGKDFDPELAGAELDQRGCEFRPFLGVMRDGSRLRVRNSDPVLHNIHTYEIIGRAKKSVFNVSQPPELKTIDKTVKLRRGTAMKIECDAHDFMHAFTFVAKNPYFAVVDADGNFTIDDVPPGTYRIRAWHGTLGERKGKVTVEPGGTARVDFVFRGRR